MREPLVIAVAQPQCVSFDVDANAMTHAETVRAADARVVVFPELSLTGYELDASVISVEDPRLTPIVAACAETGSVALAGAPVQGEHIAMLAIDADGVSVAYNKMWLVEEEAKRFVPGDAPAVFEVDGWRLGLAICKDTGVLQHAADTASLGMDVYVAGVLESGETPTQHAERARRVALTHGVRVAIASFAGPTGGGYDHVAARSGIWDADGSVIAEVGTEIGAIARATLS
ncbi:carbon-nitrogen hydrolase family protein [Allokutzneria oryzae]|uniref:Carbon-nitrogen hydrolase family protein n=1 Tax=Allokutzneria oryzae TaxID=1378989 RepID=A0ABV6A603_9PSEU